MKKPTYFTFKISSLWEDEGYVSDVCWINGMALVEVTNKVNDLFYFMGILPRRYFNLMADDYAGAKYIIQKGNLIEPKPFIKTLQKFFKR